MGGSYYPSCKCQPQLDLINKFHHLDLDIAFSDHSKREVEEIHHCTGSIKKPEYNIVHCGCPVTMVCESCGKKSCSARKMHAISKKTVTVGLHLQFVVNSSVPLDSELWTIAKSKIIISFSELCPAVPNHYHLLVGTIEIEWEEQRRIAHEWERAHKRYIDNEELIKWAEKTRPKIKELFGE